MQVNEVRILDVAPSMAAMKTVSFEYTDYLQRAKINWQWPIVDVLREPVPKPAAAE